MVGKPRVKVAFVSMQLALLLATTIAAVGSAADAPMRTWTDRSGEYRVEARFVSFQDDRVQLQTTDGSPLSVAIEMLSASDRIYVTSLVRRYQVALQKRPLDLADLTAKPADRTRAKAALTAKQLFGIGWYTIDEAIDLAGRDDAKPVMWFRVLGSLNGFM